MFGNKRRLRKPSRSCVNANAKPKSSKESRDKHITRLGPYGNEAAVHTGPHFSAMESNMTDGTGALYSLPGPARSRHEPYFPPIQQPWQYSCHQAPLSSSGPSSATLVPGSAVPRSYLSPYQGSLAASTSAFSTYQSDNKPSGFLDNGRQQRVANGPNLDTTLQDHIWDKMSTVLTAMDGEKYIGDEASLDLYTEPPEPLTQSAARYLNLQPQSRPPAASSNQPSKVWLYSNSRLPPHLPLLKLYLPSYPLIYQAAEHSLRVYNPAPPTRAPSLSQTHHIPASPRHNTKALTITTLTLDTTSTILIAIRGTSSISDWSTNLRPAPTSPPADFLPDPGNHVHAGFLTVALAMLAPLAASLTHILQERPERCGTSSLCFTGHSAGGAVAALLYCHVMARDAGVHSDLKAVAEHFKRCHCITFGAPPVSLLPLQRPEPRRGEKRVAKSLFLSFVNEGDPVARADVAVVKSLVRLYASPAPAPVTEQDGGRMPVWNVPPGTLSCVGRLVLLRSGLGQVDEGDGGKKTKKKNKKLGLLKSGKTGVKTGSRVDLARGSVGGGLSGKSQVEGNVTASVIADADLRGVVFGDLMMHMMKVYERRIDALAHQAVTGDRGVF